MDRLTILPDPRFESDRAGIQDRLAQIARRITPQNFLSVLPPSALEGLDHAIVEMRADEGSIWLVDPADETCLAVAYNSGPDAAKVLLHRQPLDHGLISMVFANERPFVLNGDDQRRDRTLDQKTRASTLAMVAVPLYFLGHCRGVISCVRLDRADANEAPAPGLADERRLRFEQDASLILQRAAETMRAALNLHCLSRLLGVPL